MKRFLPAIALGALSLSALAADKEKVTWLFSQNAGKSWCAYADSEEYRRAVGVQQPAETARVITFAGDDAAVIEGAVRGVVQASQLIQIPEHQGVHPRVGAADVVPFIPMEGATMADAIANGSIEATGDPGAADRIFGNLDTFMSNNNSGVADDVDGDPVFLAKNDFYLNYTKERAEGIVFSNVKDVKKKG